MLETYPEVLEIKDICAILRIGRRGVYQMLKKGALPYRKIGRCYKIPKDAIIHYLNEK